MKRHFGLLRWLLPSRKDDEANPRSPSQRGRHPCATAICSDARRARQALASRLTSAAARRPLPQVDATRLSNVAIARARAVPARATVYQKSRRYAAWAVAAASMVIVAGILVWWPKTAPWATAHDGEGGITGNETQTETLAGSALAWMNATLGGEMLDAERQRLTQDMERFTWALASDVRALVPNDVFL